VAGPLTIQRGELSARLRNLLRLRGTINPELAESIVPTVQAADLDQPAYRQTVRGWVCYIEAAPPHPVSELAATVALNPGTPGAATILGYKLLNNAVGVDYGYFVQIANRAFEGGLGVLQAVDTDHFGVAVGVPVPQEVPVRMGLNTGYSSLGLRFIDKVLVDQFPAGPLAAQQTHQYPLTLRGDAVVAFVVAANLPVAVQVWGIYDPDAPST